MFCLTLVREVDALLGVRLAETERGTEDRERLSAMTGRSGDRCIAAFGMIFSTSFAGIPFQQKMVVLMKLFHANKIRKYLDRE